MVRCYGRHSFFPPVLRSKSVEMSHRLDVGDTAGNKNPGFLPSTRLPSASRNLFLVFAFAAFSRRLFRAGAPGPPRLRGGAGQNPSGLSRGQDPAGGGAGRGAVRDVIRLRCPQYWTRARRRGWRTWAGLWGNETEGGGGGSGSGGDSVGLTTPLRSPAARSFPSA